MQFESEEFTYFIFFWSLPFPLSANRAICQQTKEKHDDDEEANEGETKKI